MATIKAIEGRTVHQIQSGQVIVDLCSVVKELVENSLDAGATNIDVRFKNQGLDSIEVQDNGDGITPDNYETVALKHHTSKLSSYNDLATLMTFGFRGEALSSLCALSKFTITTCRADDAPKGTKLEFEQSGRLKGTSVAAAQKGTTVSVENLFHNLPVRRQELQRKIKTEWNRVVNVLGQYACIQTGVKISVSSQAAKGKKNTLFSTKGNPTTRENIVNVFGAKTLTVLLPLDLKLELEATKAPNQRWTSQENGNTKDIHIIGHISRPAYGEGRQTPDRQMFFVNSRPCGLPQVAKAFNEVYKSYNSNQSPFVFANIMLDTHMYDVNVSPDKRTILLHDQTRMLEELKTKLIELFEAQDHTVPISQLPAVKQPAFKQLTISRQSTVTSSHEEESDASESGQEPAEDRSNSQSTGQFPSAGEGADSESEIGSNTGSNSQSRPRTVSGESVARDNLVSDLLGKGAKVRDRNQDQQPGVNVMKEVALPLPKMNPKLAVMSSNTTAASSSTTTTTSSMDEEYLEDEEDEASSTGSPKLPHLKRNFNENLREVSENQITMLNLSRNRSSEVAISGLVSATQMPPPSMTSASEPSQRRTQTNEAATRTTGRKITSFLGMPSPKRQRIERRSATALANAPVLPSFGNKLSQRFAAGSEAIERGANETETDLIVAGNGDLSDVEGESDDDKDQELPFARDLGDFEHEHDGSDTEAADTTGSLFVEESPRTAANERIAGVSDDEDEADGEYVDEAEKKAQEDAKVQDMIKAAEAALLIGQDNGKRTATFLKGATRRKDATCQLKTSMSCSVTSIATQLQSMTKHLSKYKTAQVSNDDAGNALDSDKAEEKLSLTINKTDFAKMRIVGQFNLGFILATRSGQSTASDDDASASEDLFIIDQHASDEKYNFERLQNTTIVQSQRLVQPKTLDLTAVEEEIVLENLPALAANGFIVTVDTSGDTPVGQRCQLTSLPLSRETTFSLRDLEELISLLSEQPSGSSGAIDNKQVPRPSKVRKMFAMRACRSSIMIGKTLNKRQMAGVVRHMGEIDKPWNCPHGRPTMRHLCGLGRWDESGWREGDGFGDELDDDVHVQAGGGDVDWAGWMERRRG